MLYGFLQKRPLYRVKGLFKVKKEKESWNVLRSCVLYNTINELYIFSNKSAFKKSCLVMANNIWNNLLKSVINSPSCYFVIFFWYEFYDTSPLSY